MEVTQMSNVIDAKKVVTGEVRLSYVHLLTPVARPGEDPKYSAAVLIPKHDTATLQRIQAAIQAATEEGRSLWKGAVPPNMPTPLHDGDGVKPKSGEPYGEECRGHYVMNVSTKQQPGVVGPDLQPIMNQSEVYSGMYGRVSLRFYPYNSNGNKGIGCGLNNVQKLRDGEPLGGRSSPDADFGAIPAPAPQYGQPAPAPAPAPQYGQPAPAPAPAPAPQYGQPQQQPAIDPMTGQPVGGGYYGR